MSIEQYEDTLRELLRLHGLDAKAVAQLFEDHGPIIAMAFAKGRPVEKVAQKLVEIARCC